MTVASSPVKRRLRQVFRATNLPAAIAIVVMACAAVFADRQNLLIHHQQVRSETLAKLNLIRARLEGDINGNLQLIHGIVAIVASEPDIDQPRFAEVLANALAHNSQLVSIIGAPDFVVRLVYPPSDEAKILGINYLEQADLRDAALRARDGREPILAGPIELRRGGHGVVGRFPVFVPQPEGGEKFWGLISAIVDIDRLYADSGLLDANLSLDVAMFGRDASGAEGTAFFGDPRLVQQDPVVTDVQLPAGSWRIVAVPKGGWDALPENAWLLRLLMLAAGTLIILPVLVAGRLIGERQKHICELKSREDQLARLSRRLELALASSQVGVWEYNITTGELVWDDRMDELHGLPPDGRKRTYEEWKNVLHPDDVDRAELAFAEAIEVTGRYESDYRLRLLGGEIRHLRAIGAVYKDVDGAAKMVGVNWDVSRDVTLNYDLRRAKTLTEARNAELLMAKARIEHASLHDSLTGLPNRRYLDERLDMLSKQAGGSHARVGVLHIDLDRFKQINDTLGHAAGDAMLVHASNVLKKNVRVSDFLARVGGDEFVIICRLEGPDADHDAAFLAATADRIIVEMRQPVPYHGHECRFGVSVGIAIEATIADDLHRLLVNADIALYRAKRRGRNRYQFFNAALEAEIVETKRLADEILIALERGQFVAYFQPQVDAETLEVAGAEALARWNHPTRGVLGPDAFMKTAEELNVVSVIDRLILEQAHAQFLRWREAGLSVPKISVNVSARRLQDEELLSGLRKLNIEPGTVSFELIESIFLDEQDDVITWAVDEIKELGIEVE
ncbi:MAG: diguanylate cyclase, partial [Rhizobiaceae bacterium]